MTGASKSIRKCRNCSQLVAAYKVSDCEINVSLRNQLIFCYRLNAFLCKAVMDRTFFAFWNYSSFFLFSKPAVCCYGDKKHPDPPCYIIISSNFLFIGKSKLTSIMIHRFARNAC